MRSEEIFSSLALEGFEKFQQRLLTSKTEPTSFALSNQMAQNPEATKAAEKAAVNPAIAGKNGKHEAKPEDQIPKEFEGFTYASSYKKIQKLLPDFVKVIEHLQKANEPVTNRSILEAIREKLGKKESEREFRARTLRFLEFQKILIRKKDSFEYTVQLPKK